jgi:hypothetical protein
VQKSHGKAIDDDTKRTRVFYIYDPSGCKCSGCEHIAESVAQKLKNTKLPKFASLQKLQSAAKTVYKTLKKSLSSEAAKAAASHIEEIASNQEASQPLTAAAAEPAKKLVSAKEDEQSNASGSKRQAPLPPTTPANNETAGGTLMDGFATVDSQLGLQGQVNADGTYLQGNQVGQHRRQEVHHTDPPPPPDGNEGYRDGVGGDPDPSDGDDEDDDSRRSDRGRRRRRRRRDDSPDPSPHHSSDPDLSDEGRDRSSSDRRSTHATTVTMVQPQKTVLVQQTTLAAAGCPVFTGNPFQYIPWRSLVDSVFKFSQDENALRHSQLLRFLGGKALKLVDDVQINAHDSALTVLDNLHKQYYRPEFLKDLRVTKLLALRVPGKNLVDYDQIVDCQKYIQCMKEVLECDTSYGVEVEWERIITKLMTIKEVRDNHYKKWILKCEETADRKHAGYYKDLPEYMKNQNLKFPRDRFEDLMHLFEDILKIDRYRSNYATDGGYNNPKYIEKAARESIMIEQQRHERIEENSSRRQLGYQHRGNKKEYKHNYKTDSQSKAKAAKTTAVNATNAPNTPKPPNGFGNARQDAPQKKCIFCNKTGHWGQFCKQIRPGDPGVNQRLNAAVRNRKCLNCLGPEFHVSSKCEKPSQCGIDGCLQKHHKLLHGADFTRIKAMTEGLQRSVDNAKKSAEEAKAGKQINNQQGGQPKKVKFKPRGRSNSRGRNNQSRGRSNSRGPNQRQQQQGGGSARAANEDTTTGGVATSSPSSAAVEEAAK